MASNQVELELPWPPSNNRYYRHVASKTLLSAEGRDYRGVVSKIVGAARARRAWTCPLDVRIAAFPPDRRRRDLDNVLKATLDALQYSGVFEDDGQVDALSIYRAERIAGGSLTVRVLALDADYRRALGDDA